MDSRPYGPLSTWILSCQRQQRLRGKSLLQCPRSVSHSRGPLEQAAAPEGREASTSSTGSPGVRQLHKREVLSLWRARAACPDVRSPAGSSLMNPPVPRRCRALTEQGVGTLVSLGSKTISSSLKSGIRVVFKPPPKTGYKLLTMFSEAVQYVVGLPCARDRSVAYSKHWFLIDFPNCI